MIQSYRNLPIISFYPFMKIDYFCRYHLTNRCCTEKKNNIENIYIITSARITYVTNLRDPEGQTYIEVKNFLSFYHSEGLFFKSECD